MIAEAVMELIRRRYTSIGHESRKRESTKPRKRQYTLIFAFSHFRVVVIPSFAGKHARNVLAN
jgi:hypothetical protein